MNPLASLVVAACADRNVRLATAESCTGGLIAAALTDVPGSSAVLDRGFVTYSNEAKAEMLGVPMELIERHGAVSHQVAAMMALGAVIHSHATMSVAVTGIAGPGGGSAEKPVGLVFLAAAHRGEDEALVVREDRLLLTEAAEQTGRTGVRAATVKAALQAISEVVSLERP